MGEVTFSSLNPKTHQHLECGIDEHYRPRRARLFEGRSRDRWGLGFCFYDFSDTLQDAAAPLAAFDDEAGVEAWYGFAITPNAELALNAQVIDPATARNDVALVLGARLGLHF